MNAETKKTVRRLDFFRGILVVTLILYIAVALIINSSYLTVDRLMRLRSNVIYALSSSGETLEYDEEDSLDLQLFQDGYAVLSRNEIVICGADGNIYSQHVLQYKEPVMKVCGKYILCFDRGNTAWCLLNSFRVLCSGTAQGDILNGAVTDDGYFALAVERSEYKGSVTVYNTSGTDLSRWNSDTYLIDAFFTSKNRLTIVSVSAEREKTHTVFTVFNYKKPEAEATVTASDTFPLALAEKENGNVEMLTSSGVVQFDGTSVSVPLTYQQTIPGLYCQSEFGTLLSYRTMTGTTLVQGLSSQGTPLFSAEYSTVLSLGCGEGYYFVLTPNGLDVLDESGSAVLQLPYAGYSRVLISSEISILTKSVRIERLDLSSLP